MRLLHYIEIENFKSFGAKQRIELDHPTVLIGPNNSGKTTVLQALALWSQAVKHLIEAGQVLPSATLNRLAIVVMPVPRNWTLWHGGATSTPIGLTVGVWFRDRVQPLAVTIRYLSEDSIECSVDHVHDALVQHAAGIGAHLLYSMSGLATDEPLHQWAYLNNLLGQGRTAETLRNLCLLVHGHDPDHRRWAMVTARMEHLFGVRLSAPVVNARGVIDLTYKQDGVQQPLDLAMAGRGFLQMLLILAYLYSREGGVLLIDEPDAHLEILRQKQVYTLLRDLANETGNQVIIVTHAEAVLEEAAERNLTLLRDGTVENVAARKDIRDALKFYGARHFVRARTAGHVLYVEGSTDVDMLRALATRLGHPVADVWDERANVYFVEDNYPEPTAESELERVEGGFGVTPEKHFFALRGMVTSLRGLAILDNDGKGRADSDAGGLTRRYWHRYEAENYFITPELLLEVVGAEQRDAAREIVDALTRERVFRGSVRNFETYQRIDADARRAFWEQASRDVKLSDLAEEFFRQLGESTRTPMLLRKGELHQLVALADPATIDPEVRAKLDLLLALWT